MKSIMPRKSRFSMAEGIATPSVADAAQVTSVATACDPGMRGMPSACCLNSLSIRFPRPPLSPLSPRCRAEASNPGVDTQRAISAWSTHPAPRQGACSMPVGRTSPSWRGVAESDHQLGVANSRGFFDSDLRWNALLECFHMADDADHFAAGVQRIECGQRHFQRVAVQRAKAFVEE